MKKPVLLLINGVLRLADHPALYAAAASGQPVIPVFIYDPKAPWALGGAARWWLRESLKSLANAYESIGSQIALRKGSVVEHVSDLLSLTDADSLYLTRSYTPHGVKLEGVLHDLCENRQISIRRFAGQLLLEPEEVRSGSGKPYSVFTPFWKQARTLIASTEPLEAPDKLEAPETWPEGCLIDDLGLDPKPASWAAPIANSWEVGEAAAQERLDIFLEDISEGYQEGRDVPGVDGTSRMSPYLAVGIISPRQIWYAASKYTTSGIQSFLRELGWREFCTHLLFHRPEMPEEPLREQYRRFPWQKGGGKELTAWQRGQTGFPVVDAGMRQLWQTGWMHNRVRMIVASFLVKDLLWHWRDGENWFWDTLVDADLANNAANWQWVAGCGADASPYFRIFNPITQGEKFDKKGAYVRAFVPELAALPDAYIHRPFEAPADVLEKAGVILGDTYPKPIIDRKKARERALAALATIK